MSATQTLTVQCGRLQGEMNMRNFCIQIPSADGSTISVTPADFERLAGKAHCKKWKHSIRVCSTERGIPAVSLAAWAQSHKVQLPGLVVKPIMAQAKNATAAGREGVSSNCGVSDPLLNALQSQPGNEPLIDIASITTTSGPTTSEPLDEQPSPRDLEHIFNTPRAPLNAQAMQQDRHYGSLLADTTGSGAMLPTADNSNSSGSADQDLYLMNLVGLSQDDMLQLLEDTGSALPKEAAAKRLRIAATECNLAEAYPSGDLGSGTPDHIITSCHHLPEPALHQQQHQQYQQHQHQHQLLDAVGLEQEEQQVLHQLQHEQYEQQQHERYNQQRHQHHADQHHAMPQHQHQYQHQHQHQQHGPYQAHQHLPAEPPRQHAQKRPLERTTQLTTGEPVDLTLLLECVQSLGGCQRVTRGHRWHDVALALQLPVARSMQLLHLYIAELLHLERCSVVVPVPRQQPDTVAV